jgi:oligosaccharide repeat unit polymerase
MHARLLVMSACAVGPRSTRAAVAWRVLMYEFGLVLSLVCWLGILAYFYNSGSASVFHPLTLYSAFHGLVFVIRPIFGYFLHYRQVYMAYQFTPSEDDRLIALYAANLGFVAFAVASLAYGKVPMRFKQDAVLENERERLVPAFVMALVPIVPIGLYSLAQTVLSRGSTGDVGDVQIDKASGVIYNTTSNGYVTTAQLMVATAAAIFVWLFRFRAYTFIPLVTFVAVQSGSGGRAPFVQATVTVILLWLYEHRRKFPDLKLVLAGALLVLVFVKVGEDRGRFFREIAGLQDARETLEVKGKEAFLESMDYGNLEMFELLVYAIPQRTHTYGYFLDNLQIFTEPVPRVWWPDKPRGPPFNRIFLMDYAYPVGMTRSLPGEGWYSLGWFGVVIWCSLWGGALGYAYTRYVRSQQTALQTASYMILLSIMMVAYRDGLLLTVFRQGLFFYAPVVIWALTARRMGIMPVAQVRQLLARRLRRDAAATQDQQSPPPTDADEPDWQALPPAVRRRRRALRVAKAGDSA